MAAADARCVCRSRRRPPVNACATRALVAERRLPGTSLSPTERRLPSTIDVMGRRTEPAEITTPPTAVPGDGFFQTLPRGPTRAGSGVDAT